MITIGEQGTYFGGTFYQNLNINKFEDEYYLISHRAILTVNVTTKCNARCTFCSLGPLVAIESGYISIDDEVRKVKQFCLDSGVSEVAFTGGEPTLKPLTLLPIVEELSDGFSKKHLHTNGFNLLKKVVYKEKSKTLIEHLFEAGLTGISISLNHFDQDIRKAVMGINHSLTDEQVQAIFSIGKQLGISMRVSSVMVNPGYKSYTEIDQMIEWIQAMGAEKLILRMPIDMPDFYDENDMHVSLDSNYSHKFLGKHLEKLSESKPILNIHKEDIKVVKFAFPNNLVVDLVWSKELVDNDYKVRRFIMKPDGKTYTSWVETKLLRDSSTPRELLSSTI